MADVGSRENRSDDYGLTPDCLKSVLANFPPVSLDAMASSTNTVCQRFFSKYESLNSCGIDYSEFYFVFPPVSLALQVLRFSNSQKVKCVFIILWPTGVWFNSFFYDGVHCFEWVKKLVLFCPNFKPNINSPSYFAEIVTFDCASLHFDFYESSLGERVITNRSQCLLGGCDYC